ncbi:MAG TPA: L,D-transpeptidase [Chthoniobacterales bacterium]|jgi:L,D-transpeptidase YbiS|nr:L,D-transpeptidase [Chthoniobacterales bacterium]
MAWHKIVIDAKTQLLKLFSDQREAFSAPVSTSRAGLGFEPGSFKTPTGLFRIYQKIGQNARIGTIFKGRVPVEDPPSSDDDLITTRILWLDGLERENANTKERYIYIHGTNQESLVGQPVSHGCIRMRNDDIIRLFDMVPMDTWVEIIG